MSSASLAAAYRRCRDVTREHGRSYYLATKVLPPAERSAVYALYAFARVVDDIVDESGYPPQHQAHCLDAVEASLRTAFTPGAGSPIALPVSASTGVAAEIVDALRDTVNRYGIAHEYLWAFLASMRMDVPETPAHRSRYATMAELHTYMYGSAAVIGLQLLPVFGSNTAEAREGATALGYAFQLTNFLRDIADDYRRGRVYLPLSEIEPFGVTEEVLARCVQERRTDPRMRAAIAHLIAVTRSYYRTAEAALPALPPSARLCVDTALRLYGSILDQIEHADYAVFAERAVVPNRRRLRIAAPRLARAMTLRRQ